MKTKFKFSSAAWDHNSARLTHQIYKILPMYEHKEDWRKQQRTIILELKGYNEILENDSGFMILVGKLAALEHTEDHFEFRKTVFEAITELKGIKV